MKSINIAGLAGLVLTGGFLAQPAAAVALYGSHAHLTIRDCSAIPITSGCVNPQTGNLPTPKYRDIVGSGGSGLSFSRYDPFLGTNYAYVGFAGNLGLPTIKANARSFYDARIGSSIGAYQVYTWNGTPLNSVPLGLKLNYWGDTQNNFNNNLSMYSGAVHAEMFMYDPGVWSSEGLYARLIAGNMPKCGEWGIFSSVGYDDIRPLGSESGFLSVANKCNGQVMGLVTGQKFGIGMFVQMIGMRGGWVDGSHTFELAFDPEADAEDIAAFKNDLVRVPEPAALGLFGLGLAAIGLRRRKAA